jgi:hypothetical protein
MILSFAFLFFITLVIVGYSYILKLILEGSKKFKEIQIQNYDFIYGIFLLSLISIFSNFFLPLEKLTYLVCLIGFLIFVYAFINKKIKINFFSLFLILFFFIFISHTQGVGYDTQLYHLQIIKLKSSYKSIFGISNLEDRYAMNSSLHSFMALLNIMFKELKVIYIVNLIIYSFIFNEVFSKDTIKKSLSKNFLVLTIFLIMVYSLFHPFGNGTILNNLGSPEVDIAASFLFIYGCYLFLKFQESKTIELLKLLILISILILTIKINYLAILLLPIWIVLERKEYLDYFKYFLASGLLIIGWFTKSFIASGCLIFPISLTCINTNWSLSVEHVENYKNIIKSFARDTPDRLKFGDFDHTIHSFDWFLPWFKEYFLKTEILYLTFVIIFLIFVTLLIIFLLNKKINIQKYTLLLLLTLCLSLILWLQAPEIRFGYGTILSFLSISILIFLQNIKFEIFTLRFSRVLTISMMSLLIIKNFNNIHNIHETFQRNFVYENWNLLQNFDDIKIFIPPDGIFCSDFNHFCTYKKNVNFEIERKKYLYFLN